MTLPEAEFIANEFNEFTSVQSAELVPNVCPRFVDQKRNLYRRHDQKSAKHQSTLPLREVEFSVGRSSAEVGGDREQQRGHPHDTEDKIL
jgi:hypothetical protein